MTKKFIFISIPVIVISLFLTTPKTGAVTIEELMAQIQALQAQIAQLQTAKDTPAAVGNTVSASAINCLFNQNLYLGVRSDQVKCLQQYLNGIGYNISSSGAGSPGNESNYFGAKTKAAVIKWQIANNVSPSSGYFGLISRTKYSSIKNQAASKTTAGVSTPVNETVQTQTPSSTPSNVSSVSIATTTPLSIVTTLLPSATAGAQYSANIVPQGGNGSYSWWVSDGTLPPGLNLIPTRCISSCPTNASITGTPVTAWTYNFTISVSSGAKIVSQPFTMVINPSIAFLKISKTGTINLNDGQTSEIQALYTPAPTCYPTNPCSLPDSTAVRVTWTSSNNKVATVDYKYYDPNTGVISALSPGTATITANYVAGNINFTASVSVFVAGTINSNLQINPTNPSVGAGKTISLQAMYTPQYTCSAISCASSGTSIAQAIWTSSNNAVATVAYKSDDPKTAIITGVSAGVATITANVSYTPSIGTSLTTSTGLIVTP